MYSSRAGLIGYIFASWMREEIDLHNELTKQNEKIEQVMLQLQQDHQTGKLRSNSAQNSRQNSRENRESEGSGPDFTFTSLFDTRIQSKETVYNYAQFVLHVSLLKSHKADFLRGDRHKYKEEIKRGTRSQSARVESSPSTPIRSSSTPNVRLSM